MRILNCRHAWFGRWGRWAFRDQDYEDGWKPPEWSVLISRRSLVWEFRTLCWGRIPSLAQEVSIYTIPCGFATCDPLSAAVFLGPVSWFLPSPHWLWRCCQNNSFVCRTGLLEMKPASWLFQQLHWRCCHGIIRVPVELACYKWTGLLWMKPASSLFNSSTDDAVTE